MDRQQALDNLNKGLDEVFKKYDTYGLGGEIPDSKGQIETLALELHENLLEEELLAEHQLMKTLILKVFDEEVEKQIKAESVDIQPD
jgi:hypothetical protein